METIFLESWLHDRVRQKVAADPEYRRFIGKESLGQATRADIENFQLFKLRKTLAYAYEQTSFYRELFDKHGIKPEAIRSLTDLARIPFTTPEDLAANSERFASDLRAETSHVTTFITSGVNRPQMKVSCTETDIERITDFMGAAMRTVATVGDVVQIILPFGKENSQGDLLARGLEKIGAFPVKAGINLTAEEQLELINQHKPAVLFTTTRRLYRITQQLRSKHALDKLGVKTLFVCTSGYLSQPRKTHLQNTWHCDVHSHYGMTELGLAVAVDCQAHHGYHFNEADLLLEIAHPETGEIINDDREGELVFTTLSRQGTPLIRYRTRDISKLIAGPCPCGATTLLRISEVTRQSDSNICIGGREQIYPSLFDEPLYRLPQVVDYDVTVSQVDGRYNLDFTVEVTGIANSLQQEISQVLATFPHIRRNISAGRISGFSLELVGMGELKHRERARELINANH